MTGNELFALLPLMTLSTGILVLLLVVAFWRNVRLTCGVSIVALIATLAATFIVYPAIPLQSTLLIRVDGYALFFYGLFLLASLAVCLMAFDDLRRQGGRGDEFYILLLLSTLGAMVLVSSVHFASFVLGLELLSVSLYTLIAYPLKGSESIEAALKYLILSAVTSAFLLFGIALVYLVSGTLSFSHWNLMGPDAATVDHYYLVGGLGLILASFLFKLSLVPFHMWTPDVYQGAPAPVTAFVATVSKGALFVLLLRFFAMTDLWQDTPIMVALSVIAALSILAGNLLALFQHDVKRLLAYSSIAHLGYLLVIFIAAGMAGGMALATEAIAYYLFAYFVMTLGAFGVVTLMSMGQEEREISNISDYRGLFRRRPAVATAFTLILFALAGIPLTVGFIAKFYIFAASVSSALWVLLAIVIIGSGIGLYYYLRIVFAMASASETSETTVATPIAGGWTIAALTMVLLVFGVYPTPVIDLIDRVIGSL